MIVFNVRKALVETASPGPMVAALEAGPDRDHLHILGRLVCTLEEFRELQLICAWATFEDARENRRRGNH